jgi:serine/threonine-protein kinase HipA
MTKPALNVFAAGEGSGALDRSDREEDIILFTYAKDCPAQNAVSLTMPVRSDQYDAMAGLLPVFEMNLPEGGLKDRLRLQFAKAIPEFDDLDMLAIVGSSQIGRLRYSHQDQSSEDVPEQDLAEILTYRGSADLFEHLLERFAIYSGISGMQPKVLMREVQAEIVAHRGATHIVKSFDPVRYPELAANEFICIRGAAAAGIATARVQLSENRQFLVVDRFDLTPQGEYLGIEDFCVLDARRAHGRYDGSYEQIARRIGNYVSPAAIGQAREQYALMVAYACAIENGDAHLKNFSVLYRHAEDVVELAPAYDMVSTTPYEPRDSMALTLDGSKEFPDRVRLLKFIRTVTGKSERSAVRLIEQVATGVRAAIELADQYGREHKDAAAFTEKLTGAMERGLGRLM